MKHIEERGHDVGVHIHPDHMADGRKKFLYEYSYEEQYEMIKQCTDFYEEILHKKPKAFRAGKYGADYKTLEILIRMGYEFDFSNFYGQKWCGINPPLTKQMPCSYKTLTEIPVFSYKSFHFLCYQRFDKLDVEIPFMEYKCVLDGITHKKYPDGEAECIIVMFAHSFSLLKWRRHPDSPYYHSSMADRLERMMSYVNENDAISFMCLDDLGKSLNFAGNSDANLNTDSFFDMSMTRGLRLKSYFFFFLRAMRVIKMHIDGKLARE